METVKIADQYFNNCRDIVLRNPNLIATVVRYKVFAREDGIVAGSNRAVAFISENTFGPLRIMALKDGEAFKSGDPVLIIEGLFMELVNLETTYLGFLSYSGAATAMKEIVDVAGAIPVVDMSARHFPWNIIEEAALAAYLGGAAGTSTQAGYNYVQRFYNPGDAFRLYASLPHAMAAVVSHMAEEENIFPSVAAAMLFHETYPNKPITVLVDFEGRELDVAKQAFEVFGDKLFAVRLDTHGGRQLQGTHDPTDFHMLESYFRKKTGLILNSTMRVFENKYGMEIGTSEKYFFGNGVTAEATFVIRDYLDSIGANNVKIVVSSGFNKKKVAAFKKVNAPMDFIGTGSWIRFAMFTSDISHVKENGEWVYRTKVGRKHGNGDELKLAYERA
ncbi:MAG: hypothetical protein WC848_05260 [Parcubacteria group bacterium]|jgi:nicotinate phosphoribosyltransferase